MPRTKVTWPTDENFRKFAAKLADAVMRAQSQGYKISAISRADNCCCPLGTILLSQFKNQPTRKYPGSYACRLLGLSDAQYAGFTMGFDFGYVGRSPYQQLGQAYRHRFVSVSEGE